MDPQEKEAACSMATAQNQQLFFVTPGPADSGSRKNDITPSWACPDSANAFSTALPEIHGIWRSADGSSGVSVADVGTGLLRLPMAAIVEGPFAPAHPV